MAEAAFADPRTRHVSISKAGIQNWLAALAMGATIAFVYVEFIAPIFFYLGYTAVEVSWPILSAIVLFASLTAFILPQRIENPSDFILSVLFYFLFLPTFIIVPIHSYLEPIEAIFLTAVIFGCFLTMSLAARFPLRLSIGFRLSKRTFWIGFFVVWAVLNLIVFVGFSGQMRLVGFDDVYAQREAAKTGVQAGGVWYASGFLANAFNPFLLSLGLASRKWWFILTSVLSQLLLFSTAAEKIVIATIPLIVVFYFLVFDENRFRTIRVGIFSLAISVAFLPALIFASQAGDFENLVRNITSLVYLRTFCTTGAMLAVYADFFATQPWTYYSHSLIGAPFSVYPYDAPLGEVVGNYVTGGALYINANAGFFATDGFAAAGYAGVLIITIIVSVFLALIAFLFGDRRLPVICGALLPYVMTLANTSFFTSLLTGGGVAAVLLLFVWTLTEGRGSSN